jgi:hypothetical protein
MVIERTSTARSTLQRSPTRTDARKIRDGAYSEADRPCVAVERLPDCRAEVMAIARFESDDPQKLVAEIKSLWTRAQEQFLSIGHSLIAARKLIDRQMVNDAAVQAMQKADRRAWGETEWNKFVALLPFSRGIASQLEQVARALDGGRLTREELPSNYSVAYQLTTLSDAEIEAARRVQEGIMGPTATRARIIAYKKRLREAALDRIVVIEQRRARLLEAMERIKQEIEDVERELAAASSEEVPPA